MYCLLGTCGAVTVTHAFAGGEEGIRCDPTVVLLDSPALAALIDHGWAPPLMNCEPSEGRMVWTALPSRHNEASYL